jgi:RNase P protein component
LFLSVPKRFLRRAIDRNLTRRVIRESWRATGLSVFPLALLVKMRARPAAFALPGVRQRRQGLRDEIARLFARSAPVAADSGLMSGNLRGGSHGRVPNR